MDLILMASGDARRFGGNKLLEYIYDKRVFEYTAETFSNAGSIRNRIIVSKYEEILETLKNKGYIPVRNEHSERGISESIKLGIQKLRRLCGESDAGKSEEKEPCGILFAVCDQPLLSARTVEGMIERFRKLKAENGISSPILCAEHHGKRGNPVIFDAVYAKELEALTGDTGGKQVIRNHEAALRFFAVDDIRELMDIDTLEDLQEIRALLGE